MSPLARLNHLRTRLHITRPALAISLVAVLLTVAMARSSEAGGAAGTLSISDMSMCEGNSGSTTFSVTAKLTGTTGPFTFLWVTGGGGTASSTSDYTPTSFTGSMSGADGETATFDIQVNGDTDVEPDETFFVYISDVAGSGELPTYGDEMATATILDDDGSACGGGGGQSATLSINDVSLNEGNSGTTNFDFTVTRSGAPLPFNVKVDTANSTLSNPEPAKPGDDYVTKSETLMFGSADTTKTFRVVVNGDTDDEDNEQFLVKLSNVQGAGVQINDAQGLGTITNDDGGGGGGIPTLSIDDVRSLEGHIGTKNFSFTATLSGATDAFTVKAATEAGGSATAGTDYTAASKTLSFAGTTGEKKTFDVSVVGDADIEGDETFFVRLSDVQGSGDKPIIFFELGQGTIANDDSGLQNLTITSPASKSASFDAESWGGRTEFGCGTGDECLIRDSGRILVAGNLTSWEAATTATWMKVTRVDRTPGGGGDLLLRRSRGDERRDLSERSHFWRSDG